MIVMQISAIFYYIEQFFFMVNLFQMLGTRYVMPLSTDPDVHLRVCLLRCPQPSDCDI